jgi:hypothetical protein
MLSVEARVRGAADEEKEELKEAFATDEQMESEALARQTTRSRSRSRSRCPGRLMLERKVPASCLPVVHQIQHADVLGCAWDAPMTMGLNRGDCSSLECLGTAECGV